MSTERTPRPPARIGARFGVAAFAVALIALSWIAALLQCDADRRLAIAAASRANVNLARSFEEQIRRVVIHVDELGQQAARRYRELGARAHLERLFNEDRMHAGVVHDIVVIGANGEVVLGASDSSAGPPPATVPAPGGGLAIGKPLRAGPDARWTMYLSREIDPAAGASGGIVAVAVDPGYFTALYREVDIGRDGAVTLLGRDGVVRAQLAAGESRFGDDVAASALFQSVSAGESGSALAAGPGDDVMRIVGYRAVRGYPLIVAVGTARDDALAGVARRARFYLLGATLVTLAVVVFVTWLALTAARRRRFADAIALSQFAIDACADGVLRIASSGRILEANPAICARLGYSRDELLRMDVFQINPDRDPASWPEHWRNLRRKRSVTYEARHRTRSGELIPVEISANLLDVSGQPEQSCSFVRDVSARHKVEAALRDSEQRFRGAFDNSPMGMALVALDGRWLQVNKSLCDMLGYSETELIARSFQGVTHPADLGRNMDVFERVRAGRIDRYRIEKRYLRKDGETVWVVVTSALVRSAAGEPLYLVSQVQDVTAAKQAEAALRDSEGRFRTAFDSAATAMALVSPEGRYMQVNRAFCEMLGYSEQELLALDFRAVTLPEDVAAFAELRRRALAGEIQRYQIEKRYRHKDGRVVWVELTSALHRDDDGRVMYNISHMQDITERKRVVDALRASEEEVRRINADLLQRAAELEAANRELESFSYSVSHDLRGPLRAMAGFSHALVEDYAAQLDPRARDFLGRIRAGALRISDLLDALLELARVTRAEMKRETVDLSLLARAHAHELARQHPERAVGFVIADGAVVQGDARLLGALMHNLLDNAWKFTERRERATIEFGVARQPDGRTAYFVRDNGAGFDMAYAGKLFTAFQRLHSQAEYPGTGIGLASVQRIAQRHGGKVWAEGEPGRGATFYFTLH